MQIVSIGDTMHEKSKSVFWKKNKTKKKKKKNKKKKKKTNRKIYPYLI